MKRAVANMIVIGSLCLVGGLAQAQDKLRVGVLDARKVLLESKVGQQYNTQREKLIKDKRDQLSKDEQTIKTLQEKLEKDKLTLTDKQKDQKQKEIEEKITTLQKQAQDAQQQVAKSDNDFSGKATATVRDIVADIAKQEKLAMVIDKNQGGILWIEDQVDITDRVLKAYEAKAGK